VLRVAVTTDGMPDRAWNDSVVTALAERHRLILEWSRYSCLDDILKLDTKMFSDRISVPGEMIRIRQGDEHVATVPANLFSRTSEYCHDRVRYSPAAAEAVGDEDLCYRVFVEWPNRLTTASDLFASIAAAMRATSAAAGAPDTPRTLDGGG
jgi:hypothetical protein